MTTTPVTERNQFYVFLKENTCPEHSPGYIKPIIYRITFTKNYMYSNTCGYIYVHSTCPAAVQLHVCTRPGGLITYIIATRTSFLDPASAAPFFAINWFCGIFEKIRRPPKILSFRRNKRKKCIHKKRTDVENERKTPAQRNPQEKKEKSHTIFRPHKKIPLSLAHKSAVPIITQSVRLIHRIHPSIHPSFCSARLAMSIRFVTSRFLHIRHRHRMPSNASAHIRCRNPLVAVSGVDSLVGATVVGAHDAGTSP